MMVRTVNMLLLAALLVSVTACKKLDTKLMKLEPYYVVIEFFETWKKKDWKTLYQLSDRSFMQQLRTQKLSPELQRMTDQDLFVHEFEEAQRRNPEMILRSYSITRLPIYKKGDTTLWVQVLVNGKKKRIPVTLDGLSLKVDLTRIE